LLGASGDDGVQGSPAYGQPCSFTRKYGVRRRIQSHETNSAKRVGLAQRYANPQSFQGRKTIRHQSFAAGLIDRRPHPIGDDHTKPALPRGNGCCQSCGPTANYEYIG
jgi:hypothetical protein